MTKKLDSQSLTTSCLAAFGPWAFASKDEDSVNINLGAEQQRVAVAGALRRVRDGLPPPMKYSSVRPFRF